MHRELPQLNSASRRLLAAFVGVLSSACSGSPESVDGESDELRIAQKAQPVVGGTLSERESVVLVSSQGPKGNAMCTGTLIAPNLVVTARHCISTFTDGDFSCTISGFLDLSRPRSPATAGDVGLVFEPAEISIHAGTVPDLESPTSVARRVFAPETDTICRNDIAFVVLEDELSLPYESIRLDEGVAVNEPTTVIGYGLNDNRSIERTERSDVRILAIGPSDFYEVEGNALPRTFVLGTSVCPGDSGGPAFSDRSGEVLGVFSFFRGSCESSEARNFFTHIASYKNIALQAFAEAGHSELVEPPEPPDKPPPMPSEGGAGPDDEEDDDENGEQSPRGKKSGGCSFTPKEHAPVAHFLMWCFVLIIGPFRRSQASRARTRHTGL